MSEVVKCCLIIDVSCIAHRAYHSIGPLSFNDEPTGVLFGFFGELQRLTNRFMPDVTAFCFDCRRSTCLRRKVLPEYKAGRELDKDEQERRQILYQQVNRLPDLLRDMGYSNIYKQDGYEADDLIAVICKNRRGEQNIIVSSDHDLYQLIRPYTIMWSPHAGEAVNATTFYDKYGIPPGDWWRVKAIAGCPSDNIPGVKGIGEGYATRFLLGTLGNHTKAYQKISEASAVIARNGPLVRLPYKGCRIPRLQPDNVTDATWDAVVGDLGMVTLAVQRGR